MSSPQATLLVGGLVWSGLGKHAEMIVRNEAIAVADGRVLAVGSNRALRVQYDRAQVIELRGRTVVPRIVECDGAESPWLRVWSRVTGHDLNGAVGGSLAVGPLTRAQALSEATELGDRGESPRRGRLDPGWASDLMVLSGDYFRVDEWEIPHLFAELTMIGDRITRSLRVAPTPTTMRSALSSSA